MAYTNISEMIEPLKRELAVPGTFDTVFPDTDDDALFGVLADGFSEAQLDGFFGDTVIDLVTGEISPEISNGGAALVVIYSAMKIIRGQMRALSSGERYKAGNVEFERTVSASLLKAEFDALVARKKELILAGKTSSSTTHVLDAYWGRQCHFYAGEIW